jgi:uncharacterized protein YbjT (DUF2867 family)
MVYLVKQKHEKIIIIVSGGAEYVGSHIVKVLVNIGKPVRVLTRNPDRTQKDARSQGLDLDIVVGDFTQPDTLTTAFADEPTFLSRNLAAA